MLDENHGGALPTTHGTALIVDTRTMFNDAIGLLMREHGDFDEILTARTPEDATMLASEQHPGLVVLGPAMVGPFNGVYKDPGVGSPELVERLREAAGGSPILIMTATDDMSVLADALKAGANGVVDMISPTEELMIAVETVTGGEVYIPPKMAMAILNASSAEKLGGMSEREIQVITQIALGHTNSEIADNLDLSIRTIEAHRSNIQEKLGLATRSDLVRYALDNHMIV